MKKIKFIVIIGLSAFAVSCSDNKLKPEQAQGLICARYNLPKVITEPVQYGTINFGGHTAYLNEPQRLAKAGILTCEVVPDQSNYYDRIYQIAITPEGAKIKVKDTADAEGRTYHIFKSADKVFDTIIEIKHSEDGNSATVNYSIKYINTTPVFDVFGVKEKRKRVTADKEGRYIVKRQARFTKTEEGVWEMQQNQKTAKDYMNDMQENFTRRGSNSIATDDPNDIEY